MARRLAKDWADPQNPLECVLVTRDNQWVCLTDDESFKVQRAAVLLQAFLVSCEDFESEGRKNRKRSEVRFGSTYAWCTRGDSNIPTYFEKGFRIRGRVFGN